MRHGVQVKMAVVGARAGRQEDSDHSGSHGKCNFPHEKRTAIRRVFAVLAEMCKRPAFLASADLGPMESIAVVWGEPSHCCC